MSRLLYSLDMATGSMWIVGPIDVAWKMTRPVYLCILYSGLPLVGLGSFAVQTSIIGASCNYCTLSRRVGPASSPTDAGACRQAIDRLASERGSSHLAVRSGWLLVEKVQFMAGQTGETPVAPGGSMPRFADRGRMQAVNSRPIHQSWGSAVVINWRLG